MAKRNVSQRLTSEPSALGQSARFFATLTIIFSVIIFFSPLAQAASGIEISKELQAIDAGGISSRPIFLMFALVLVTLLPFVGMLLTSFVKIAVVLSITRQAIGTQQAPPTVVITGIAILLTIYIMHPVGLQIYKRAEKFIEAQNEEFFDKANADLIFKIIDAAKEPMKQFLIKETSSKNLQMFYRLGYRMRAPEDRATLSQHDFIVLVPAFVITELTKAFQIGFIIFLPFLVVDMVVANTLMALGMQMLSPTTISLPFKILLFVMVDGWYLITKGLVLGYQ